MQSIIIKITTLSNIIFAENSGDPNMVATKQFIPGSAILGLFASLYIQRLNLGKNGHKDERFVRWFLRDNLIFTNAYIKNSADSKLEPCYPLPLSIQKPKYADKENNKLLYDLLIKEVDPSIQTKTINGYGCLKNGSAFISNVKKQLNFHHERDLGTGTSREGRIFNYESICPGQVFTGKIIGGAEDIKNFLSLFPAGERILYVGRSRNAQYGKIKVEIIPQDSKEYQGDIEIIDSSFNGNEITMTLLSDTIIYNEYGYPTTDIRYLEKYLSDRLYDAITIKNSFTRTDDVETFRGIWRLKTPSEVCFTAGSCFVITSKKNLSGSALIEMQKSGIGERSGEGFGRVTFGLHKSRELQLFGTEDIIPQRPSDISEETKKLIKNIIKNILTTIVEQMAMREAAEFKRLPSKSLIGRLESLTKYMSKEEFLSYLSTENKEEKDSKKKILRKTAKRQLEACVNSRESLNYFLSNKNISVTNLIKMEEVSNFQFANILNETGININELESDYYYKLYFKTFFVYMRKLLKKELFREKEIK